MRLFVLAAGRGSRLTNTVPKCLVDLGDGSTFLSRIMDAAHHTRLVNEVVVVTGHQADEVDRAVTKAPAGLRVMGLYNPFYDIAGPLVSLWTAHGRMHDADFFVCNGDTLYRGRAFRELALVEAKGVSLSVDRTPAPDIDDMKVLVDLQLALVQVGKDIRADRADGVSTGLLCVRGERFRDAFVGTLMGMVRNRDNLAPNKPWHSVLNTLTAEGFPVRTVEAEPSDWAEVDTPAELAELQAAIQAGRFRGDDDTCTYEEPGLRGAD